MIMESLKTPCAYFVTTRVPSIYPRIRFNIQSLNISKFDTISLETWWRRKLCGWSLSTSTIKRQIFLLNPLMVYDLNLSVRPLGLVSSLDLYLLCDLLLVHCNIGLTCVCLFLLQSLFLYLFLLILLYMFCF